MRVPEIGSSANKHDASSRARTILEFTEDSNAFVRKYDYKLDYVNKLSTLYTHNNFILQILFLKD